MRTAELMSERFHHEDKLCNLKKIDIKTGSYGWVKSECGKELKERVVDGRYCMTHNIVCCRCGWEFGHHYGNESKKLK